MATKKTAAAADDNDKCENCGACKHCGNGGTKFVPYPVYPYPYALPYRPYTYPQPTWISRPITWGQTITSGLQTSSATSAVSGTASNPYSAGGGNYLS